MKKSKQHIVSNFLHGLVYEFKVSKSQSFWCMGSEGPSFRADYLFQVRINENGLFEAHYPDTIFYQVKGLDKIQDILRMTKFLKSKTIFYELGKHDRNIYLNNYEQLKKSSYEDSQIIKSLLDEGQYDNIDSWVELIFESQENFEQYILQDLINLHYCEELEIDEDYFIDLTEKDSFLGGVAKRALKLLSLNFDECSIFRFKSSEPDFYVISLFESKNALTAIDDKEFLRGNYQGIDFKALENDFISSKLDFDELIDGIYSLHEYRISKDSHVLSRYENKFKINSKKMRKHVNYEIEMTANSNV